MRELSLTETETVSGGRGRNPNQTDPGFTFQDAPGGNGDPTLTLPTVFVTGTSGGSNGRFSLAQFTPPPQAVELPDTPQFSENGFTVEDLVNTQAERTQMQQEAENQAEREERERIEREQQLDELRSLCTALNSAADISRFSLQSFPPGAPATTILRGMGGAVSAGIPSADCNTIR